MQTLTKHAGSYRQKRNMLLGSGSYA